MCFISILMVFYFVLSLYIVLFEKVLMTCLDKREKGIFIVFFFFFLLIKHFCFMEIWINESSIEYLENIS